MAARVPDPVVRGFLLQNLRRDGSGEQARWRWQMNLALLGDRLPEIADWPDGPLGTYDGPVLWLAGVDSAYVQTAYAPVMRALFPRVRLRAGRRTPGTGCTPTSRPCSSRRCAASWRPR